MRAWLLCLPCVAPWIVACAMASDAGAGGEYVDEDFPPTVCETDGSTTECGMSTGNAAVPCDGAEPCTDGVCAASFNGAIGPFECQDQCIESMDDSRWCFDASACCDAEAICDRGYCIGPAGVDGSSSSSSGGGDSTGSTSDADTGSSGTTDGGSTDTTGGATDTTGGAT